MNWFWHLLGWREVLVKAPPDTPVVFKMLVKWVRRTQVGYVGEYGCDSFIILPHGLVESYSPFTRWEPISGWTEEELVKLEMTGGA